MEILRSIRFEVDHAIVTYRGSINSSYPIDLERNALPALRKKAEIKKEKESRANRHNGELSKNAYKRLKRAVSWLEQIAEEKESDVNWKCVFLTLTVPEFGAGLAEEMLKGVLNVFLTWLRRSQGVKSYVWKAELTKKGRIHYHLLTDQLLNEVDCRAFWNHLLEERGLLDRYKEKFGGMSLSDYLAYREKNEGKCEHESQVMKRNAAYNYGLMCSWSDPKSVQLDIIPSSDSLVYYIGKYLGKSVGESDGEKLKGRIWGCSRNLSEKNVLRLQVDPMTKEVEVLKELLDVATGCEDIVIEVKGVSKTIGYRISYSSDIWFCDNSGRRLNQIMSGYMSRMREGEMRYDYQQEIKLRALKSIEVRRSRVESEKVQEKKEKGCVQIGMFDLGM